jgi:hypothetical protein
MGKNLCRACGITFGNLKSFDAHRAGSFGEPIYKSSRTGKSRQVSGHTPSTRQCLTPAELQTLGMTLNGKGWWTLPPASTSHQDEDAEEEAGNIRSPSHS